MSLFCLLAFFVFAGFGTGTFAHSQDEIVDPVTDTQGSLIEDAGDGRIRFSFDQQQWQTVIEFFADELGFALQPIVQPPEGTFTYFDDKSHTVTEAMDILNHALLNQDPSYTLIRNKNMLILQRDGLINEKLIEKVTPDELYKRGEYEMLQCSFDLSGLEEMGIDEQVQALVKSGNSFHIFPANNEMLVVETGRVLRNIDRILKGARIQAIKDQLVVKEYHMKQIDPESLLITVRGLMDFDGDSNMSRDGTIIVTVQPLGDKLYLKTTEKRWKEFLEITEMVDVPPDAIGGTQLEKAFVRTYEVLTAPTLAFQILNTNLEGREGVRMDQDEETGTIYVMGRKTDHDLVNSILDELKRSGPNYAIIDVVHADAEDVLAKLQLFFRQTTSESAADGPVLFSDSIANQISVRGKPSDVELVRRMVADMDATDGTRDGPRTTTRFIDADPDQAMDIAGVLGDIFAAEGRKNRLNIVLPKDREKFRSRNKIRIPSRGRDEFQPDFKSPPTSRKPEPSDEGAWLGPADSTYVFVSCPAPVQEQDELGQSSQETNQLPDNNYRPPEEPTSVPGAPIDVKLTPEGIRIDSEDLDALDDLEQLIRDRLKQESKAAGPTIFHLLYRRVENVKPFLDRLYGLESGGGGGGAGGLGGVIGGVLGNAMGGGAGDLISGMFGGDGGSDGAASLELEGDVKIETDVIFNALLINNATENDLDSILDILEWLDQPEAPQEMDFVGRNFYIPIFFRDPLEVKEIIENNLSKYIEGTGANKTGGQNPAQQQQRAMQEMVKAMAGGGRGGARSSAPEEESPKATLAADERNSALILTGPQYIYEKVLDLVEQIDIPEVPQDYQIIPTEGKISPDRILEALKAILGSKLIVDEEGSSSNTRNSRGGSTPRSGSATPSFSAPGMSDGGRQAIMRALQNRGGGTRIGGDGRGGGGNRGGGGARGGGNPRGNGGGRR